MHKSTHTKHTRTHKKHTCTRTYTKARAHTHTQQKRTHTHAHTTKARTHTFTHNKSTHTHVHTHALYIPTIESSIVLVVLCHCCVGTVVRAIDMQVTQREKESGMSKEKAAITAANTSGHTAQVEPLHMHVCGLAHTNTDLLYHSVGIHGRHLRQWAGTGAQDLPRSS